MIPADCHAAAAAPAIPCTNVQCGEPSQANREGTARGVTCGVYDRMVRFAASLNGLPFSCKTSGRQAHLQDWIRSRFFWLIGFALADFARYLFCGSTCTRLLVMFFLQMPAGANLLLDHQSLALLVDVTHSRTSIPRRGPRVMHWSGKKDANRRAAGPDAIGQFHFPGSAFSQTGSLFAIKDGTARIRLIGNIVRRGAGPCQCSGVKLSLRILKLFAGNGLADAGGRTQPDKHVRQAVVLIRQSGSDHPFSARAASRSATITTTST